MMAPGRDEHEMLCPRCGADAQWSFVDQGKRQIDIRCPECGSYTMAREQFDQAAVESAEIDE